MLRQLRRKLDKEIRMAAAKTTLKEAEMTVEKVKKGKAAANMRKQMPKLEAGVRVGSKEEKLSASKPAAAVKKKEGPSLGREGSVSHYMRSLILARKSNADILREAKKRFPKAKIKDNWPLWYRGDMIRHGFPEAKARAP